MPVSISQFSDVATRPEVSGTGVVTVDAAQDVRLVQSRFRLVRWIRNAGIGRRSLNRASVGAFIRSLESHYGSEVTSRMDLRRLREVHSRGRPLHVRHIRAAITEADLVADGLGMVRSSNIQRLVEENVGNAAYASLPGGEELAQELRDHADIAGVGKELADRQAYMHKSRGGFDGNYSLGTARRLVGLALSDAGRDLFLSGYGIRTVQGSTFDKLQAVVDRHPATQAFSEKYGVEFSASRASSALHRTLSEKLPDTLNKALRDPASLPGDGPIRQRIEQAVDEVAERIVGNFIQERAEALDRLYDMYDKGEIRSDDFSSFGGDSASSLPYVVLHHRIPPEMLPALYDMRNRVPDGLADLASQDCTMEHKIRVLGEFGEVIGEIFRGLSNDDRNRYSPGPDSKLNFMSDCGRFLLEGKLSSREESEIRAAARSQVTESEFADLLRGLAALRGGMYRPDATPAHWAGAGERIDDMALAAVVLLAPYVPKIVGPYTPAAGNVVTAMRNCGFEIPPPGNPEVEQSGSGKFSQAALEVAEAEMREDLARQNQIESTRYPGFLAEPIEDYSRSAYTVSGTLVEWGDTDAVVAGIRNICTDANNNTDWTLCKIVGQLAYQRSDSMATRRMAFGSGGESDTSEFLRTAPFPGNLVFSNNRSGYEISKKPDGNILVRIKTGGVAKRLDSSGSEHQYLDQEKSTVAFDTTVEVDAKSHAARVVDMRYQFHFVPTDEEP